jgi:hypothetical protein
MLSQPIHELRGGPRERSAEVSGAIATSSPAWTGPLRRSVGVSGVLATSLRAWTGALRRSAEISIAPSTT